MLFNIMRSISLLVLFILIYNKTNKCSANTENIFINYEETTTSLSNNRDIDSDKDDYDNSMDESHSNNILNNYIEKIQNLHEEGRNEIVDKRVNHINETFDKFIRLMNFAQNLFTYDKNIQRNVQKISDFFASLNINVTEECYSSLVKIYNSFRNRELWGIKCKITFI
jgi:hypothetical protein